MDATKKSARQKKREAHELSASPGPKKRKKLNDHQDSSKKRKLSSSSLSSSPAKSPSSFQNKNKKPNDKSKEESSKDSVNNEPPKQKKKMNKPKHLKRKIEQAKKEASADVEGASKKALELEKQQEDYQVKKQEAAEKFYQLCISLVGKEAWDDKKEALYQKLLSQGCSKRKLLAALGMEKEKKQLARKKGDKKEGSTLKNKKPLQGDRKKKLKSPKTKNESKQSQNNADKVD